MVARNDVPLWDGGHLANNKSFPILSLHIKSKPSTLHKCFTEIFTPRVNLLRLLSFLTRTGEILQYFQHFNIYISTQSVRFY